MGRKSDAKERLLRAAAKLIHERGFTAVSVADICAEAGVQKGSFYHFFPTKKELVVETINWFGKSFQTGVGTSVDPEAPALDQLQQLVDGMTQTHRADHEAAGCIRGCPIGNLALEMSHRCENIQAKVQDVFDKWRNWIEALIRTGIERGELRVEDPAATAEALVANLEGALMMAKAANDPSVFARIMTNTINLLRSSAATHRAAAKARA